MTAWEWIRAFTFASPEWLLALLLLPVFIWWYFRARRHRPNAMVVSGLSLFPAESTWRTTLAKWLPILPITGITCCILALARPQLSLTEEKVTAEGIDIVMAMDLSSSMLSRDFEPDRLEVSKRVARAFVSKRAFDRIGLVVFSGEAYTQCPLTTDYGILDDFLSRLEVGLLEDGTAIGMGLAASVNRLKDSDADSRTIILLTDGVNNAGYINPMDAAELARQLNIRVYTIAVGGTGMAPSPVGRDPFGDYVFRMAPAEIDTRLLMEIASKTGGKYYRATDAQSLEKIYADIDALEKTEREIAVFKRYKDLYAVFLWVAVAAICIGWCVRITFLRTVEDTV